MNFEAPHIIVILFVDWFDHSLIEDDPPSLRGHLRIQMLRQSVPTHAKARTLAIRRIRRPTIKAT